MRYGIFSTEVMRNDFVVVILVMNFRVFRQISNRCALSVVITGRTQFVCVVVEILAGSGKRSAAAATTDGNVGGTAPVGYKRRRELYCSPASRAHLRELLSWRTGRIDLQLNRAYAYY